MGHLSKLSRNKRTDKAKMRASNQPARTEANRTRKLEKHLRKQPRDNQAKRALQK